MNRNRTSLFASAIAIAISAVASAQYPQVPPEMQKATDERKKAADERSDAIFKSAMPQIEKDAANGRPYIPWAKQPSDLPQAAIPAFPGAEGGGMYSHGGRGGRVIVVTNLDDSGPGSFRDACEQAGPRIVLFNVSGIIKLKNKIRIRAPYITIAGNTAPGDGVCIAGDTVELDGHDIVIRHMRFRRGETDVTDRNDSIGGNPVGNVMIDHVSASWGLDENMSMYRHMYSPPDGSKDLKLATVNITIQNSIFSECLNMYNHAFGSTIGGYNSTFHHNLWACNSGRNPSVGMNGDFGFVNNVIFNWVHRSVDGGDDKTYFNIINNYFKPGPATNLDSPVSHRVLKPESSRDKTRLNEFGHAFVSGNIVEGNDRVTRDNWDGGVQLSDPGDKGAENAAERLAKIKADQPFPMARITMTSAQDAYTSVLANAGALLPKRDPVDTRVVEMVRTGKVAPVKSHADITERLKQIKFQDDRIANIIRLADQGIIYEPAMVGGYPEYKGEPYEDADDDGLPDAWEKSKGLNPFDGSDAATDLDGDGYTNVEEFINGTNPQEKVDYTDPKNNVDPRAVK